MSLPLRVFARSAATRLSMRAAAAGRVRTNLFAKAAFSDGGSITVSSDVIPTVWICLFDLLFLNLPNPLMYHSQPRKRYIINMIILQYSGGQASEGQGGFYGSGGARAAENLGSHHSSEEERTKMLAMAADVQTVTFVMEEFETLEHLLQREETENPGQVSGRSIEIKNSIKKLLTNPDFQDTLNRLTLNGSPVWGLSMSERELIETAREKVTEC